MKLKETIVVLRLMKKLLVILSLSLVLLPVLWNGIGLVHYLVEHTHVFCMDDTDHIHQTGQECSTICQLTEKPSSHHFLTSSNDYQELKLFLTPNSNLSLEPSCFDSRTNFSEPLFVESSFSTVIFHPPIS